MRKLITRDDERVEKLIKVYRNHAYVKTTFSKDMKKISFDEKGMFDTQYKRAAVDLKIVNNCLIVDFSSLYHTGFYSVKALIDCFLVDYAKINNCHAILIENNLLKKFDIKERDLSFCMHKIKSRTDVKSAIYNFFDYSDSYFCYFVPVFEKNDSLKLDLIEKINDLNVNIKEDIKLFYFKPNNYHNRKFELFINGNSFNCYFKFDMYYSKLDIFNEDDVLEYSISFDDIKEFEKKFTDLVNDIYKKNRIKNSLEFKPNHFLKALRNSIYSVSAYHQDIINYVSGNHYDKITLEQNYLEKNELDFYKTFEFNRKKVTVVKIIDIYIVFDNTKFKSFTTEGAAIKGCKSFYYDEVDFYFEAKLKN